MRNAVTPEELNRRSTAILDVLSFVEWARSADIARLSDLPFGVTKALVKRLCEVGSLRKREFTIRVVRGAVRKRYTSKKVVEYQLVITPAWPDRWLPRPPAVIHGARKVCGRCGCGG